MVDGLITERQGSVVRVTLAAGEENLLDGEACEELAGLLLSPPEGAHVLRLSARGPNFCLGRVRAEETPAGLRNEVRRLVSLLQAFSASPLVSVAEVQGPAAGFGVALVAACDVAIASPAATFSFPEVRLDLAPVVVLSWLPKVVGTKAAFHLAATGGALHPDEALRLGLLTKVTGNPSTLAPEVDGYLAELGQFSPRVHREIKAFLAASEDMTVDQAYELAVDRLVLGSMARRRAEPSP